MPTYRAAEHGVSLSEAAAEAYAIAPTQRVMLDTLELLHSSFVDDEGNPDSVRVVCNSESITATIEAGAPMHAGAAVEFVGVVFGMELPEESDKAEAPSFKFWVDGVSNQISEQIEAASETFEPVLVIHRTYASDDLTGPSQLPVLTLEIVDVDVTENRVTATALFGDSVNRRFPASVYDERYPGLTAR